MKRFYTVVTTKKTDSGYAVTLDGKPVKTPYKAGLVAQNETLANAIVQEWAQQEEEILPESMPLTQILSSQIDRVSQERPAMTEAILKYLNTDLICYYADHPPELAQQQRAAWQPVQAWFENRFNIKLETTDGLKALAQPEAAHKAVADYVAALDDAHFTALQIITPLSGSLILAIAFLEGEIDPEKTFAAMRVEETFKAEIYDEEKYGPDPAQHKKDEAAKTDLNAAAQFLKLIKP